MDVPIKTKSSCGRTVWVLESLEALRKKNSLCLTCGSCHLDDLENLCPLLWSIINISRSALAGFIVTKCADYKPKEE